MRMKHFYTAAGRFERRTNADGRSYPIIILGGKEYMVDLQEMVIWTCLNWRIVKERRLPFIMNRPVRETYLCLNDLLMPV